MELWLTRNAFFFAQEALFGGLVAAAVATLHLSGPVMLPPGIAFGLSGLAVVILMLRLGPTGMRKRFFMLTGASAAVIPLASIAHKLNTGAFSFEPGLLVFPATFAIGWVGSAILMGTSGRPVSKQWPRPIGLVIATAAMSTVAACTTWEGGERYSVTSELMTAPEQEISRVYITVEVDEALIPVFRRSFEHSLVSAFASNGVDAIIELIGPDGSPGAAVDDRASPFAATIHIDVDPLYRSHRDGYEALVGTVFEATLTDNETGATAWHLSGKVDYIADAFFKRHGYSAHEGIRKEFAWTTTAAVVRTFMVDVNGRPSAPIYTVTEDRQRHGQRTD